MGKQQTIKKPVQIFVIESKNILKPDTSLRTIIAEKWADFPVEYNQCTWGKQLLNKIIDDGWIIDTTVFRYKLVYRSRTNSDMAWDAARMLAEFMLRNENDNIFNGNVPSFSGDPLCSFYKSWDAFASKHPKDFVALGPYRRMYKGK